ncbi:MAG: diguanylate cyclase [Epsilonproteobacteria bacterium]|nr:diguanylate cyclase [Campylobacterota bacterium]
MKILCATDDIKYSTELVLFMKKQIGDFEIDVVNNLTAIKEAKLEEYDIVLFDLTLKHSNFKFIKDNILPFIPVILLTQTHDNNVEKIKQMNVVDYIIKNSNYEQIAKKLQIIDYFKTKQILVVDDSKVATLIDVKLVKKCYPFAHVFTAANGVEALVTLKEHPDIKLIITDYEMPKMDGKELVENIRLEHDADEIAIIAISSNTNKEVAFNLLKVGANDFITKPFVEEEMMCRIDNNVRNLILIEKIKDMAFKDPLTNLYNRRSFFEQAQKLVALARREGADVTILMCDIDHFKQINDKYGHQTGDMVIVHTANVLLKNVRANDLVCRYGGEEFVIFLYDCPLEVGATIGERIRKAVENSKIVDYEHREIQYTISIGVSELGEHSLEEAIKIADDKLYEAKKTRNRVVWQ